MTEKDTGGSAFPTPVHNFSNDGMILRDYFAAKALQGWIASRVVIDGEYLNSSDSHCESVAHASYKMADAMLEARK